VAIQCGESERKLVPELPEVETVRRGLLPVMEGRVIAHVELRRADLRWPLPERMVERMAGQRVLALRRRSKYLLADLASGETLIVHLGMSGRLLISGEMPGAFQHQRATPGKHDHVIFDMAEGARITFNDARRFGAMDLAPTGTLAAHWLLAKLGPEPLGNGFSEAWLAERLRGRTMAIKPALLDQRIVAGLGNIYVCEALFRAGISPRRRAGNISRARTGRLVMAIRQVLREAIEAGGTSLRDYRHADGELGYFQHRLAVYGREAQACPTTGCGGHVRRIVQSGRSSFYCPSCQR